MDLHNIDSIDFGIYSAEEIRAMAVCRIDNKELKGQGTVYDKRMGGPDGRDVCETCNMKKECWGHYGYIELVEPILHPLFYKEISMILKCFCKNCSKLLVKQEQLELSDIHKLKGKKRFEKILQLKKIDTCAHCSSPQPKITFASKTSEIRMEYSQKKGEPKISVPLTDEDIKKLFDIISDEDVIALGFNPKLMHPRNLILTVYPVIPPSARPPVTSEGNTCDDDITYQLLEIIKINNQLAKEGEHEKKRQKLIQSLKFRISTLMSNSSNKARHPTDNRPLKGVKERLSGKAARMRGNLLGKRTDQSSRTVIGADPTLKLCEFVIPEEIAKVHTRPEFVNKYNIDYLTKLVNEGKANQVITTYSSIGQIPKKRKINVQHALVKRGTDLIRGDLIVKKKDIKKIKKGKDSKVIFPLNFPVTTVVTGYETFNEGDKLIREGELLELEVPVKKEITLKIGDIVEKQLAYGSIGVVNRQPTLHKGSMHAMILKPMPYKSFRFNLGLNKSLNADFDGDEMNLHACQNYETEAELVYNCLPKFNIISPQESKNIITIVQDSLIASYLMTKDNKHIPREQFFDIVSRGENPDGSFLLNQRKIDMIEKVLDISYPEPCNHLEKEEKKAKKSKKDKNEKQHKTCKKCEVLLEKYEKKFYNGRNLFSLILPETLYYENKNGAMASEPVFKVVKGIIVSGAIDKGILGSAHNSLIQIINKEYGPDIVSNFIDNIHFISNGWMSFHGFSVGLEDCMLTSDDSQMTIKNTLTQCYVKAESVEQSTFNSGIKEVRVTAALSQARDIGMKISKEAMSSKNNFLTTVISGAKGDYFNIAQLTSLLGQQNLEGQRVAPQLNNRKRTLPHYPIDEEIEKEREYESRGFIRNSFIHGLSPEEFFFHGMSGREGVCDTAMSTANSGYIQRKILKTCEDIQIKYDKTVRDSVGKIVQYVYGQNGFDPTKTVLVDGKPFFCDVTRLVNKINNTYEENLKDINIESKVDPEVEFEIIDQKEKKGRKEGKERKEKKGRKRKELEEKERMEKEAFDLEQEELDEEERNREKEARDREDREDREEREEEDDIEEEDIDEEERNEDREDREDREETAEEQEDNSQEDYEDEEDEENAEKELFKPERDEDEESQISSEEVEEIDADIDFSDAHDEY